MIRLGTAIDAINVARSLLGINGRPNKVSRWYSAQVGDNSYLNADWCAMTISYALAYSGSLSLMGGYFAYVPYLQEWFSSKGQWHSYNDGIIGQMKTGDILIFDWTGNHQERDHVGIVEKVNSGGTVTTLEGDEGTATVSGGQMSRNIRDRTYITGFGRPAYTDPVVPTQSGDTPLKLLVEAGLTKPPVVIPAGQRQSVSFDTVWTPGLTVSTGSPSVYPTADAAYAVTVELGTAGRPLAGVYAVLSEYTIESAFKRPIRTEELVGSASVISDVSRLSKSMKYRVDIDNKSAKDVTVNYLYLTVAQ